MAGRQKQVKVDETAVAETATPIEPTEAVYDGNERLKPNPHSRDFWRLYQKDGSHVDVFFAVDAREMLQSGDYSAEPPAAE